MLLSIHVAHFMHSNSPKKYSALIYTQNINIKLPKILITALEIIGFLYFPIFKIFHCIANYYYTLWLDKINEKSTIDNILILGQYSKEIEMLKPSKE